MAGVGGKEFSTEIVGMTVVDFIKNNPKTVEAYYAFSNLCSLMKIDFGERCQIQQLFTLHNRTTHIRHQCRKTTVLSCHRCIINTGVEKINNI
jgi:hypothetical protein